MALQLVGRSKVVSQKRDVPGNYQQTTLEQALARQLDMMQYASETQREKVLKKNWHLEAERIYNLTEITTPYPSFRPKVMIPEIQMQALAEASDLSDISPLPYIVNTSKTKDQRDESREKALQAEWKDGDYNLAILMASLWSIFTGNAYLRVSYDPDARNGMGAVRVTAPHPASVYPDPFASSDEDMKFVIFEEFMYINEVRRRWDAGMRVLNRRPGAPSTLDTTLQMPAGPMSTISGMPGGSDNAGGFSSDESRVRVRFCWVRDYAVKYLPPESEKPKPGPGVLVFPKRFPAYPDGRMIVECEGVSLLDRTNPWPLGIFPVATVHGFPPLTNYFSPPPIRYTLDLQRLAERMLTQTFENAIRVNNGITFVYEDSGIDLDEYGGIPGGVHMIAQGSKAPEFKWPAALPQHMVDLPKQLLEWVKELNGFTPARKGMPGAGNLSAPLFDASVLQAQSLTRLRARLLAKTIRRLARIVFMTMGRMYTQHRDFPTFIQGDEGLSYEPVKWEPLVDDPSVYQLQIDENSIRPFSQVTMRMLVPMLRQMGALDQQTMLEMLEIPNSEKIRERLGKEAQQAAQMAALGVKPGAKGKKK